MSQPSSDFEAGLPGQTFDEVGMEQGGQEMLPALPQAPMYRKQGFNIYSVMLIVSFVFLTAAAILLFMEIEKLKL